MRIFVIVYNKNNHNQTTLELIPEMLKVYTEKELK